MKTYLVLRIHRTPVAGPEGEETLVKVFPIFKPIQAFSASEALERAVALYPLFRLNICVQEKRSYEYHAYLERERIRRLRASPKNPSGGKSPAGRPETVH